MDHSTNSKYQSAATQAIGDFDPYVVENGSRFTVPYRTIKMVTFTNVSQVEMVDAAHAARLQYRLLLLNPVIKAVVDFTKSKITVIFNPETSDNNKEKISLEQLRETLKKEGITTRDSSTTIEDYDYYKSFYSRGYNPPIIRETTPYGWTQEQWRKLKPAWEKKVREGDIKRQEKFRAFQQEYLKENPEAAVKINPNKPGEKKQL